MLPIHIEANYRRMTEEGLLSEKEHAFFTDKRLVKFWRKAEKYLSGLPADNQQNAAECLTGAILTPLAFGYGVTAHEIGHHAKEKSGTHKMRLIQS